MRSRIQLPRFPSVFGKIGREERGRTGLGEKGARTSIDVGSSRTPRLTRLTPHTAIVVRGNRAMEDLVREAQRSLLESSEELVGALVYVDEAFAGTARDAWGVRQILGAGAVNVCSLEGASPQDADRSEILAPRSEGGRSVDRVAVFTGRLLHEAYPDVLRLLAGSSGRYRSCAVFTTLSEETYSGLAPDDMRLYPFESFREKLLAQLRDLLGPDAPELRLEVKSCPLAYCPRSSKVFTVPVPESLAGSLAGDLDVAQSKYYGPRDFDPTDFEEDVSPALTYLGRSLSDMCSHLGWDTRIFARGRVSKVVAKEIASVDRKRRKHSRREVSLVLLDRALDLVTPALHADSDLDRLAADGEPLLTAGALGQPADGAALSRFDLLCGRGARDAARAIRRELREALLRERIPSGWRGCSRPGAAVSAGEIEALKSTLGSDEAREQKHASLLRYADLAARGLSPDHSRGWDFLVAAEEVVLHVALDGEELPTQYLLDLAARIKRERLDCLSRADVARLAFVAHVVVSLKYGPEGAAARLETLRDFLVELRPEGEGEGEEAQAKIGAVLERLERATSVCCQLNREAAPLLGLKQVFKPLVSATLDLLSDPSSGQEALEFVPGSLGGMLASGLGRFGFKTADIQPKPGDADTVVIFVLGQVSPLEVKLCADRKGGGKDVFMGSLDVGKPETFARTAFHCQ